MEKKETKKKFFSYRNVKSSLSDGISLFTDNATHLFKLSLPVLVVYSLLVTLCFDAFSTLGIGGQLSLVWLGVACVSAFIAATIIKPLIYNVIRKESKGIEIKSLTLRTFYDRSFFSLLGRIAVYNLISLFLIALAVAIVFFYIKVPVSDKGPELIKLAGFILLFIFFLVFVIAYRLVLPYVVLGKVRNVFKSVTKGLKKGFRYWGKMMQMSVLVFFIVSIIAVLILSPAIISSLVDRAALISMVQGDAVDLPSSFGLFRILVTFISTFIVANVMFVNYSPLAYTYASIVTDEEEMASL